MNPLVPTDPGLLNATERNTNLVPERVQAAFLQEQFTGSLALRSERPLVELLAERLAERDASGSTPVFVP